MSDKKEETKAVAANNNNIMNGGGGVNIPSVVPSTSPPLPTPTTTNNNNNNNNNESEKSSELKGGKKVSKEKKEDIKGLINNKYQSLKEVLSETADNVAELKRKAIEAAKKAGEATWEKSKDAAEAVDEHVHQNPWYYIGGVAVSALLLGYTLGKKNSDK